MPFPRAKANLYEYGIHMPLAMSWPAYPEDKKIIIWLASLTSLARFDAAQVTPKEEKQLSGEAINRTPQTGESLQTPRKAVFSGREGIPLQGFIPSATPVDVFEQTNICTFTISPRKMACNTAEVFQR